MQQFTEEDPEDFWIDTHLERSPIGKGTERRMLKGKILLVIALYMILGVLAFVNFGVQGNLTQNVGEMGTVIEPGWRKVVNDLKDFQLELFLESNQLNPDQSTDDPPD